MNAIKFFAIIGCISLLARCTSRSSSLPAAMPAGTELIYDSNADSYFPFNVISIRNDSLYYFEKKSDHDSSEIRWQAAMTKTEIENTYQLFRENKIDLIKNDSQPMVVWQGAASQDLTVRIGANMYFVSYGKNTPLSKNDAKRFNTVADAMKALKVKYGSTH